MGGITLGNASFELNKAAGLRFSGSYLGATISGSIDPNGNVTLDAGAGPLDIGVSVGGGNAQVTVGVGGTDISFGTGGVSIG